MNRNLTSANYCHSQLLILNLAEIPFIAVFFFIFTVLLWSQRTHFSQKCCTVWGPLALFPVFVPFCFLLKVCCFKAVLGVELQQVNFIQRAKTHLSSFTEQPVSAAVVGPGLAAYSCRLSLQQDKQPWLLLLASTQKTNDWNFHLLLKSNLVFAGWLSRSVTFFTTNTS